MPNAKPLREKVSGAPFQPGDRVTVVWTTDEMGYPEFIGKPGVVVYLEYECGCGQTYPTDPMIGVQIDGQSTTHEFWKEELKKDEHASA